MVARQWEKIFRNGLAFAFFLFLGGICMAAENISDQNGRSFEYSIVTEFAKQPGVSLTERAIADQSRDKSKFDTLPAELRHRFEIAAAAIVNILTMKEYFIAGSLIDRLPDTDAMAGDVTDIRLTLKNGKPINLSIKNNHHALKHQRPPSLMQQLGFPKKSAEDLTYRRDLQNAFNDFYRAAGGISATAENFRDIEALSPGFIDSNLYGPVCDLVFRNLKHFLQNQDCCRKFFTFLVGNTDYIKIVLSGESLEITDFYAIPAPTQCEVTQNPAQRSYIYLHFNNGWIISLRLHTASSRMGSYGDTPSTKFDTQPVKMPLKKTNTKL